MGTMPASGSRRTKVLTLLAALAVAGGSWSLATGTGSANQPARQHPFGPNPFSLARNIVRSGPPAALPTTTTTGAAAVAKAPHSVPSTHGATPTTAGAPGTAASTPSAAVLTAANVDPGRDASAARVAAELIAAVDSQSGGKYKIPATPDNVALLERWMANEGGLWADNPLNTSLHAASYPHQFTSGGENTGIPIFPTMTAGVDATAQTLLGSSVYARILATLRSGTSSCTAFATAVIHTPWASSHYGYSPSGFCRGVIAPARGRHQHRARHPVAGHPAAGHQPGHHRSVSLRGGKHSTGHHR